MNVTQGHVALNQPRGYRAHACNPYATVVWVIIIDTLSSQMPEEAQ